MLLIRLNKNLFPKTLPQLNAPKNSEKCKQIVNYCNPSITKLFLQCRTYMNDSSNHEQFPTLSDDPLLIWPSILKSLRTYVNLQIINKTLDKDFYINDFVKGSEQALSVVSNALAREDYETIKELVTLDTITSISKKISSLNFAQKQLIAINKDDIFASFPYQVDFIKDEERDQRKIVRITVVYHSLKGFHTLKGNEITSFSEFQNSAIFVNPSQVANYRFIRDFTDSIDSPWQIDRINHFLLKAV